MMYNKRELVLSQLTKAFLDVEGVSTVDLFDSMVLKDIKYEAFTYKPLNIHNATKDDIKSATRSAMMVNSIYLNDLVNNIQGDIEEGVFTDSELTEEALTVIKESRILCTKQEDFGNKNIRVVMDMDGVMESLIQLMS